MLWPHSLRLSTHQKQPCIYHYSVITCFFCSTVNTKQRFKKKDMKIECKRRLLMKWWLSSMSLIWLLCIVAVHNSVPQSTEIPSFYLIWYDGGGKILHTCSPWIQQHCGKPPIIVLQYGAHKRVPYFSSLYCNCCHCVIRSSVYCWMGGLFHVQGYPGRAAGGCE